MKILFVGADWQGSSDRSLREALANLPAVCLTDLSVDHYFPRYNSLTLRLLNRLIKPLQQKELFAAVFNSIESDKPDVLMIYKGFGITSDFIRVVQSSGICVVNIFPDHSPNTYGRMLKEALGCYDLVISTKVYHPELWGVFYGYSNKCVFVPHGYDPRLHYWEDFTEECQFDVALCATWRPQYHQLMLELAENFLDSSVKVAIAGAGWGSKSKEFPSNWQFHPNLSGRAYGEFLRMAKIVIAPVNSSVTFKGNPQPGDQDTTRSYELAAMHCFFLHQRTPFVQTIYDENTEVPLWSTSNELSTLISRFLIDGDRRKQMAASSHTRAVPAYSIPERARAVFAILKETLEKQSEG